jgi:hypothetical protein
MCLLTASTVLPIVILSEVAAGFLIGALSAPAATKSKNLSAVFWWPTFRSAGEESLFGTWTSAVGKTTADPSGKPGPRDDTFVVRAPWWS